MSWVIRHRWKGSVRTYDYYFTGTGHSPNPNSAVRFTQRNWAVGMLRVLGWAKHGYRVVRRNTKRPHHCKCACCPCLKHGPLP
jgi:hypothetical protein